MRAVSLFLLLSLCGCCAPDKGDVTIQQDMQQYFNNCWAHTKGEDKGY